LLMYMEQSARLASTERWKCVAYVVILAAFWSVAAAQIRYSISEEVKEGTLVGNIAKDLGIDKASLKEREYRIVGGSAEPLFRVNKEDGILYVNRKVDREEICERSNACIINLKTVLENPLEIHYVAIEVLDVNDHPPTFPEKEKRLEIFESTLPGARFQLQAARDPDGGQFTVQQYRLTPNDHFRLEVKDRGEDRKMPFLILQKALDREAIKEHRLMLTAVDGGRPAKSGTMEIIIRVLDVNDNSPVFTKDVYTASLNENSPPGTLVIRVNATDLDEGANGDIIYSFGQELDTRVKNKFDINPRTGDITVAGVIDFEENKMYEIDIRVEASDKGQPPMSAHCKVLVEVLDVNDNAPELTVTSLHSSVREDANVGLVVALLSVLDKDGGKNGQVSVHIKNEVPFKLETNYRNYYSLLVDRALDRETVSAYSVTIVASDGGTPFLTSSAVLSILISDVNDNPPLFSEPLINAYIGENMQVGAIIKTVTATDVDIEQNGHVKYCFLPNDANPLPLSSMININSETGDIISLQSFNYEELKTFQFKVQATDSGVPPLSSNVTVNVFILDENDNSPTILAPYSEHGSVNSESIPYSAEAGYFVAKIRAVDADSGYNALLSYHLSEPKGNNLFRMGTSTGEIRTKRRMSDNDLKTHPLVVLVSDNGDPSLSATVSIEVVVVESAADIQTQFRHVPMKEESFSDLNLYLLIAIVSVSAIFLLSLITLIAVRCHRTDGGLGRYSTPMITTHPDGSWSYSKSTQQYDVCFSSDTLKSDVVVFPAAFPPVDGELISINGGDTFTRTQTLPNLVNSVPHHRKKICSCSICPHRDGIDHHILIGFSLNERSSLTQRTGSPSVLCYKETSYHREFCLLVWKSKDSLPYAPFLLD
uniref:Protocadherin 2 alpha b 1 n=1 Tax=Takifugu rubripes TaxID=31033 RepID=H2RTB2_TAKRU